MQSGLGRATMSRARRCPTSHGMLPAGAQPERPWWRPFRRFAGIGQAWSDRRIGRFARWRGRVDASRSLLHLHAGGPGNAAVGRAAGVPSILESPNGHLRAFRDVYVTESARHCGRRFQGHPTPAMVERVNGELALAGRVRVSSHWAVESLASGGVPARAIDVPAATG